MTESMTLLGGVADGSRAPAMPIVRALKPTRVQVSGQVDAVLDVFPDEELYRLEKLVLPFEPPAAFGLDVRMIEPDPWQWNRPTMWVVRLLVTEERKEQIGKAVGRLNVAAERCGGWAEISRVTAEWDVEYVRRRLQSFKMLRWERDRLLSMLRPGYQPND